jgi:CRP-like cAMP-binding protein
MPNANALGEKGATVHTLTGRKEYVDFLESIPAFSSCTRAVLDEFVNHGLVKVHCAAGKKLSPLTEQEQNLYVLAAGSALLSANDVAVTLVPGDYFGRTPDRRHHIVASVLALSDIEILVMNPQEVARIQQTTSRDLHPPKTDWRAEFRDANRRSFRRSHRRSTLVTRSA